MSLLAAQADAWNGGEAMSEKPFEDWDFNDLKDWALQSIFDGLVSGGLQGMKSALHAVLDTAIRWGKNNDPR